MEEQLAIYKRERPDIFARLPLPTAIAKQWGIEAKDEVVSLNAYLIAFLQLREEPTKD